MKRTRTRTLLTTLLALFVLWQIWQKVHIVFWVPIPWWGLLLLGVGAIVLLDLMLDRFLRDS